MGIFEALKNKFGFGLEPSVPVSTARSSSMKKIEINPITRLEGHGKIAIFLDDNGNVDDAFFRPWNSGDLRNSFRACPWRRCPGLSPRSAVSAAAFISPPR